MSIAIPPRYVVAQKASPQGPAAGILQTEYPLLSILGKQTEQQKMQMAWKLGVSVPWIRAAERVIGGEFATVGWHLEDENEEEITAGDAFDLIATPQMNTSLGKKLTRNDLWRLTCRHMGLCGNAFWYLDGINTFGQPNAILYIRPDRMTPVDDEQGNLIGWFIDRTQNDPGVKVRLEQIVQFMFEPPDVGHFGIGLVESALLKAQLSTALDRHLGNVIDAGGRLSGIMAPKSGTIGPDTMLSLERDWRAVVEQDNAAKRLQLVAAPVDFTPTTMSLNEIGIRDLITGARDDLLGLWGVPISKLGIHDRGKGLGASSIIENDDAILWQDGVKPRLGGHDEGGFVEAVQALLDRFADTDGVCELVIDEPTFDDDAPKYVEAQQALNLPLRNRERRDILGLEPLGDKVINPETGLPLDDEVWMPMTMVRAFIAPMDGEPVPMPAAPTPMESDTAGRAAGETTATPQLAAEPMKADVTPRMRPFHETLVKLRTSLDRRYTPKVRTSVAAFLDEQRHDIAERIRKHAAHLTSDPGDTSVWFPARTYDEKLAAVLAPTLSTVAGAVSEHVATIFEPISGKADPVVDRVLQRGAARVTKINQHTRDTIQSILAQGVAEGMTMLEIADGIESGASNVVDVQGILARAGTLFAEYRSELIARTEMMDAYNAAALGTYRDAGIEMVEAIDGDQDDECIARLAGNPYTVDAADMEEDHPNGTLDWVPVLPGEASLEPRLEAKAGRVLIHHDTTGRIVAIDSPEPEPPPQPAQLAPVPMRIERDENGRIRRVVPEGSEPDARIVDIMHMFRQSIDAQNTRPIEVHVAAPEPPIVNIPAPIVNVPAPIVQVTAPPPQKAKVRKVVHRDANGDIDYVDETSG